VLQTAEVEEQLRSMGPTVVNGTEHAYMQDTILAANITQRGYARDGSLLIGVYHHPTSVISAETCRGILTGLMNVSQDNLTSTTADVPF